MRTRSRRWRSSSCPWPDSAPYRLHAPPVLTRAGHRRQKGMRAWCAARRRSQRRPRRAQTRARQPRREVAAVAGEATPVLMKILSGKRGGLIGAASRPQKRSGATQTVIDQRQRHRQQAATDQLLGRRGWRARGHASSVARAVDRATRFASAPVTRSTCPGRACPAAHPPGPRPTRPGWCCPRRRGRRKGLRGDSPWALDLLPPARAERPTSLTPGPWGPSGASSASRPAAGRARAGARRRPARRRRRSRWACRSARCGS